MVKYRYDGTDILDDQSLAKHRLISAYLQQYYLTYFADQRIPKLRIAIVDGFSGGGVFQNGLGTPLLSVRILRETELAISTSRKRPIEIEPRFYFIDADPVATTALAGNMEEMKFQNEDFQVITSTFAEALPDILPDIRSRYRAERAIFILDPYGYKDIKLDHIRQIANLKNSEVIWLVTTDHISQYLSEKVENVENVLIQHVGVQPSEAELLKNRLLLAKENGGWQLCRHLICEFLVERSGFQFASDFPIRMMGSNKDYTILHLAHHQKAREVMVSGHWQHGNDTQTFCHNGLNYVQPSHTHKNNDLLFSFTKGDRDSMISHAAEFIANKVLHENEVRVSGLSELFACHFSAMTNLDIVEALRILRPDFDYLTAEEKETRSLDKVAVIKKKRQLLLL